MISEEAWNIAMPYLFTLLLICSIIILWAIREYMTAWRCQEGGLHDYDLRLGRYAENIFQVCVKCGKTQIDSKPLSVGCDWIDYEENLIEDQASSQEATK